MMNNTGVKTDTGHNAQPVSHPKHYNSGKIEVWDAIVDWNVGFLLGNVIKYCVRAGKKGSRLVDLAKAREYIDKAIAVEIKRSKDAQKDQIESINRKGDRA